MTVGGSPIHGSHSTISSCTILASAHRMNRARQDTSTSLPASVVRNRRKLRRLRRPSTVTRGPRESPGAPLAGRALVLGGVRSNLALEITPRSDRRKPYGGGTVLLPKRRRGTTHPS